MDNTSYIYTNCRSAVRVLRNFAAWNHSCSLSLRKWRFSRNTTKCLKLESCEHHMNSWYLFMYLPFAHILCCPLCIVLQLLVLPFPLTARFPAVTLASSVHAVCFSLRNLTFTTLEMECVSVSAVCVWHRGRMRCLRVCVCVCVA